MAGEFLLADRSRGRNRQRTQPLVAFSSGGVNVDPVPYWELPFGDLGNGVVSTTTFGGGIVSYARAGLASTRLSNGLWKLDVAADTPRSYYTASGIYIGYKPENSATELLDKAKKRDLTNAVTWVKTTMNSAFTSTGIDGTANSCTRLTATGATSLCLQTVVAAASSRTFSAFVKRITGNGTINIQQGATTLDITALINSTAFTRVELNASVLNAVVGFQIITSGDAIDVDYCQFEAGPVATTPIDPASGVRAEDAMTVAIAAAFPLTVYFEGVPGKSQQAGNETIAFHWDDGTVNNRLYASSRSDIGYTQGVTTGGVAQVVTSGGVVDFTNIHKEIARYATNDSALFVNGSQIGATDTSCAMPAGLTTLRVGSITALAAGYAYGGGIKNIKIYSSLNDAQCLGLSSL